MLWEFGMVATSRLQSLSFMRAYSFIGELAVEKFA
jgi:hypothetical protein